MDRLLAVALSLGLTLTASLAEAQSLKIAVSQRGFWDSCFVEFAQREGFFREEKLDVEFFYTDGGAATLDAVMSGSVDVGMSNGLLGVIGRYSKGAPLRVVSAEMTGAADAFWYARADSGIKSLKDARGKSIAFSSTGSSTNLMVLALLKEASVNARPVAAGGAPATFTQVMTKQIDIGWSVPPFGLQDLAEGKIVIVARGSDVPEFTNQTVRVNVAMADTVRAKRDALTRYMKAYARAIDWAYQNPKALEYYAEIANISVDMAHRTRDEFYPKAGVQVGEIKRRDLSLRDALAFRYISQPMTPKEAEGLFDILYKPTM
jgi:NitT/TauT family transport system substrate-binding protein